MSRSQRAGDSQVSAAPPPSSSSRYPRQSLRSHKGGLGSSSTKVQVVGDGHKERGYDSEIVRDGAAPVPHSGYYTEGQPSTKRTSQDLYRAALDPRRNGARLSSMPSSQSPYAHSHDHRQSGLDDSANVPPHAALRQEGDESAAEQNSSLRRVKKDKERRHRDRERDQPYDQSAVPASVWMAQVAQSEPKSSRAHRRESRSRPRHEETPQQIQHDLPRTFPHGSVPTNQDHHKHAPPHPSYNYNQHPSHYRAANATPTPSHDYYRPPDHYVPSTPLLNSTPRYQYVIDDRAGMSSPPPVEVPHAFPPETTPATAVYYDRYATGTPTLQPPRTVEQLREAGLIPSSPLPGHRRHRAARSEDVGAAGGVFADGTEHTRPLRHQPSRSEDLRKLGHGSTPVPDEHPTHQLARPVHVGRSASETTIPQQAQLATPGMYTAGLAVTPAAPAARPGGLVMHPQLQESFAESANASRAPVNAAMASAAIMNTTDSDSSRERRRRTRRSKQVDASPLVGESGDPQLPSEPTPPPVVIPSGKRPRTTSGRSAVVVVGDEKDDDMVVYRTPEPVIESSRPQAQGAISSILRSVTEAQPVGLAIFGSMTPAAIMPAGARAEPTHVSRPEMTSVGAGPPRADGGYELSRGQVEHSRGTGAEVAPRRGSVLDGVIAQEERTRKPSNSGTEERIKGLDSSGKRSYAPVEEQRRPSAGAEGHRRSSLEKDRSGRRRSVDSDASLDSFQSAELAASTAATQDAFYPAQDFHSVRDGMSAREAMSPVSNYHSIAPSVRSMANDVRSYANEVRNMVDSHVGPTTMIMQGSKAATMGHRPHANTVPPVTASKERVIPAKPPAPVEPEMHGRPRIPSNNMVVPPEAPVHRSPAEVHAAQIQAMVDEEGRITRGPIVASTMPARQTRTSISMQRPPQTQTVTPVTSPPQTHAQTQLGDAHASALPKNMQHPQPVGSSKESLVDSTNVKAGKSKSSRWGFWGSKSKPVEPTPKAPSPTPPPAPSASQPRVRQPSILGGLMPISKSKSTQKSPEHAQAGGAELYASYDSTPSSLTLNLEPEPKKEESRMPRMFASVKNALRRTPSSTKISHGISRSMSRLPGTSAPASGAPLARSVSTNGRDMAWPGSPSRPKEPLKSVPPPPAIETVVSKDVAASIPPAPATAPAVMPTPVPAPAPAVSSVPPLVTPKPQPAPVRDDRRPPGKDVPIVEKARTPAPPGAPRASLDQSQGTATKSRTLVDAQGRLVDASGRPIDSVGRSDKRSSTQAPPHPRAASPPLVTRPVTATRIAPNQTNIFTSAQTPRASAQPAPVPSSSRTQGSRGGRSSRDYVHAPVAGTSTRPPRAREPVTMAPVVPVVEPSMPAPAAELGLPTPDATPRASPTGEDPFEGRAAAIPKEKERDRERSRPANIVVPPPDLGAVNSKLKLQGEPAGGVLKFVHRQKRAVSIASLEAVTGQEAHFRSEASSIRTVTPGPGQTSFPNRDPHEATEDWRMLQLQEDMRLNAGKMEARRESISSRMDGRKVNGVLKKRERGGLRKAGVAFDFPGPVIDEDGEDQFNAMKKADIEMTYELERRKKRYK